MSTDRTHLLAASADLSGWLGRCQTDRHWVRGVVALLLFVTCCGAALAQSPEVAPENVNAGAQVGAPLADATTGVVLAPVVVDGREIIHLRGTKSFSAARRAAEVRKETIAAAQNDALAGQEVRLEELDDRTHLLIGEILLLDVFDADAQHEGFSRTVLAESLQGLLQEAIADYRQDRDPAILVKKSLYALAAVLTAAALLLILLRGGRRLDGYVEQRLADQLKTLERQSARFVKRQQSAKLLRNLLKAVRAGLIALTLYFSIHFVLNLYPWTRGFAVWLFDLILDPLEQMGRGLLAIIPDLVFLVILYFVTRYILRMIQAFFRGIDSGGEVLEVRVQVTRLRSLKNEEIVIPNTTVLNSEVTNYTTLASKQGLILHTTVGIGYETPWRQVEAMLKQAAERTSGLQKNGRSPSYCSRHWETSP